MILSTQPDTDDDQGGHEGADALPNATLRLDGSERRRGLRIRQARPVKIYEPTASRYFGGETADVSATGLRLELPAFVPVHVGKVLSVHVGTAACGQPLANRRGMIPARVVWVDRRPDLGRRTLTLGIEFVVGIAAELDAA